MIHPLPTTHRYLAQYDQALDWMETIEEAILERLNPLEIQDKVIAEHFSKYPVDVVVTLLKRLKALFSAIGIPWHVG